MWHEIDYHTATTELMQNYTQQINRSEAAVML